MLAETSEAHRNYSEDRTFCCGQCMQKERQSFTPALIRDVIMQVGHWDQLEVQPPHYPQPSAMFLSNLHCSLPTAHNMLCVILTLLTNYSSWECTYIYYIPCHLQSGRQTEWGHWTPGLQGQGTDLLPPLLPVLLVWDPGENTHS